MIRDPDDGRPLQPRVYVSPRGVSYIRTSELFASEAFRRAVTAARRLWRTKQDEAEAARIREDLETWPGPGRRDDLNSGAVYEVEAAATDPRTTGED